MRLHAEACVATLPRSWSGQTASKPSRRIPMRFAGLGLAAASVAAALRVSARGSLGRARLRRQAGAQPPTCSPSTIARRKPGVAACVAGRTTDLMCVRRSPRSTPLGVRGSRRRSCASIAAATAPGFAHPSSICGAPTKSKSRQRAAPALSARVGAMPRREPKSSAAAKARAQALRHSAWQACVQICREPCRVAV